MDEETNAVRKCFYSNGMKKDSDMKMIQRVRRDKVCCVCECFPCVNVSCCVATCYASTPAKLDVTVNTLLGYLFQVK